MLNGTKIWAPRAPAWAHLRGTPGAGNKGHCQEQGQGRHCGFVQPLCTTQNHKVQEKPFTSAHPPKFISKCEGVPSCCLVPVLLPNLLLLRGYFSAPLIWSEDWFTLNRTLLVLLKSILSCWEWPSRQAPVVLLFTGTSDPPEIRIMYNLMSKSGRKSTLILPNRRQQANVEGLSFLTNKHTDQPRDKISTSSGCKKRKKCFKFSILSISIMINTVTRRGFFSILGVCSLMQHMQMEALSMNPLCTICTSACSHRPCCYSCINNSDGHQSI